MIIGQLPNSWRIVGLHDIAILVGGGTPSRKSRSFFQGETPWVTGADFVEDRITFLNEAREYITDKAIEVSATNRVPESTILITTRVNVGKVAVAQVPLCFSQDITGIMLKNPQIVDSQYLVHR